MTDITRKRGDTYADVINISSAGSPLDVTGYTFLLTVDTQKAPSDTSTQVYQLTGTILDAVNGQVEFAPSAVQADQVGGFYYDVQMTDGAGRKRTVLAGKYKYVQDITKV